MFRKEETMRFLGRLENRFDRVAEVCGRAVSWLCVAMMLMTCAVVVLRHVFNVGFIAMQESVMFMHGIMFMSGIAFALKEDAHVRVDIAYQRFGPQLRAVVNILGALLFLLPFCAFVAWVSFDFVRFSWDLLESSAEPGGLPGVFLLKTMIPLMALTLALQGIAEIVRSCRTLAGATEP